MRGWHPSIAMTSVVPERSAPIIMTGRSLRLSGMLRSLQVADPGEEIEEGPRRGRLESGVDADLLQDRLAAVAVVDRHDRGAQLGDLLFGNLRRGNERPVGKLTTARDDTAAVLFPGATTYGDGVDNPDVKELGRHRPADCRLVAHGPHLLVRHDDVGVS